jgi:hypothetical protein
MSLTIVSSQSNFYDSQQILLEDQKAQLTPILEKIERISNEKLSKIAIPTMKHWLKEFKQQSYTLSVLKILTVPTYASLLSIGFLNCYASIELLCNGNFSSALSSDIETRVDFANTITNAGALFACLTDFPAITYAMYLFVIQKAHRDAMHEALDESYHSCVVESAAVLNQEMHEELYQKHISILQDLGVDNFYLNPDLLSKTGALYGELAPLLQKLDLEIKETGLPIRALLKNGIQVFRQESCTKKLGKVSAVTICLFAQALSIFLILENSILIKDTPMSDLFSSNSTDQNNEAFYMTQLGGLFSSLTAFGASTYVFYLLFLKVPYQKTMREKIQACVNRCNLSDLSYPVRNAFYRLKEIKLKKFAFY